MANEDFICVRCAQSRKTCCQRSEVYVTSADVARIAGFTGEREFYNFRAPDNPAYAPGDDDTVWQRRAFRADGRRRVLRRRPDGDCHFLAANGCTLPLSIRPLVCRLYPFEYDEHGIHDDSLATGCPLELLRPGQGLIEALEMNREDARGWHRQLYDELLREPDALNKESQGMIIGLTYDLRSAYLAMGYSEEETAEFDRESTIDALAGGLEALGHQVVRIGHARQLAERLAAGERWDLVFNICEGLKGMAREAQVPAMLDVYDIPYTFSDPLVMALTLHKGLTKTVVRAAGVPTPVHVTVENARQIDSIDLDFPLFVKPAGEGTGKGVDPGSIVRDRATLKARCLYVLERFSQPALVETYLPGRELTVGILGTGDQARVLGTLEIVLLEGAEPEVYSYVNKEDCERLVEYRHVRDEDDPTVREAEAVALAAWRALGCRDGGRVDLRCDAYGGPQFIEVNPLAGLHPQHSDLPMIATAEAMPYTELLDRIVQSAACRVRPVAATTQEVPVA